MKTFVAFIAGAAIGSVATWYFTKEYYARICEEEILEAKGYYQQKYEVPKYEGPQDSDEAAEEEADEKPNIMEYAAMLQKQGYTNYSNSEKPAKPEDEPDEDPVDDGEGPYVIAPEEFGEIDGYETISLTYYEDQVLTDDNDELVDDVEGCIGFHALTTFGKYEDDSVFVRNDTRKCDYEILKDPRRYSDVIKTKPHLMEAR